MVERVETRVPDEAGREDYGDVGSRVAAVLNAAEEAAEQIRTDARRTAEDIRREAEAEARRYANERRRDADVEGNRVIGEANAHARSIREAAHTGAREIEEDAHRRREQFRVEVQSLEKRVERALDGLRDVTAHLQQVVLDAAPKTHFDAGPEEEPPPAALELEPAPERERPERPWHRIRRGGRRKEDEAEPSPTTEDTAELASEGVYESLRDSVEKVGDRWVAKKSGPPAPAGVEAPAAEEDAGGGVDSGGDLYERAKELGIKGRGRMSTEELAEAVAAAEGEQPAPS